MPPRDGEPAAPPAARGVPRRELDALREVRESARALLAAGQVEETWEFFLSALEAVLLKNRDLELLVAKLRRARIGMTSERMDPAQLALLFEAWLEQGGADAPVDPEAEAKEDAELDREIERADQAQPRVERTKHPKGPGWQTRGVQRDVHRVEVPEAERTCGGCGRAMKPIGADVSRRLEYVPAHFVEHEYHREKYACGSCKDGVTTAPAPPQVLERSAAGASRPCSRWRARTIPSAWLGPLKKSGSPKVMCWAPAATWRRMSSSTTSCCTTRKAPLYTGTMGQ